MHRSKCLFVNGKPVQVSGDVIVEMMRKYSKECASPNEIFIKVSQEMGLSWTKKSVTKLKNLYNKHVKVSEFNSNNIITF